MSRPRGSPEVLETRRRRALDLLSEGLGPAEVARRLGCASSSVSRWRAAWRARGTEGLKVRPSRGRPLKLGNGQKKELQALLQRGARAFGFGSDAWTAVRIAYLIERRFGVSYHPHHVYRLLRSGGDETAS